jgi:hypothetical protein
LGRDLHIWYIFGGSILSTMFTQRVFIVNNFLLKGCIGCQFSRLHWLWFQLDAMA